MYILYTYYYHNVMIIIFSVIYIYMLRSIVIYSTVFDNSIYIYIIHI